MEAKMHKTINHLLIGLTLLALCSSTWAQNSKKTETNPDDLWSQFKLITERNIFSRQRGRPKKQPRIERKVEPERPRYVPTAESTIVLKGIVKENNEFVAFLEDTRDGSMLRIKAGQEVARGKLTSLTLDKVVYVYEEKPQTVTIGQNLEGGYDTRNVALSDIIEWSGSSTPSESTESTPETSSAGASDMLKMLMERRRQQLGD